MKHVTIALGLAALLVAATLVAACSAAAPALVGPTWKLVAVGDLGAVEGGEITFAADGQVSFRTGCNTGGGTYEVKATSIDFSAMMMTEMACDEPRSSQEAAFISVLDSDPSFIVAGDRLTLGTAGNTLAFERA
jgi:heat shock protein HslJ